MGAASLALLNTAETLFLKRVGVAYLPWALLASSGLLVVTTGLASRLLSDADRPRWLPRVLLGLGLTVVPFWALVDLDTEVVFGALVLVSRQVLALGMLTFWVALGDLVTGRQAKRLFAPLTAGITLGMIGGSFGSNPVGQAVGIDGLLLACALLLAGSAFFAVQLRRAHPARLDRVAATTPARTTRRRAAAGPSARQLTRDSRLFRLLVLPALCGGLLGPVLYFEFSYVADASTSGPQAEQELLALYSQFRGWLNIATLFAQLWLSSRLYRRLGVPLAVALWPLSYLAGFVWLSVQLGLRAGVVSLGGARVAEDGIAGPGLRVLWNLFPEEIRSRAASLLEGPITRVGGVSGNAIVLGALAVGGAPVLGWVAIPIAALWLACMLLLRRAYPGLLLQASADRSLAADADKAVLLDPGTLRALAPSLVDPNPRTCRAAVDLVADADPELAAELLAEAIRSAPEETHSLLVAALHGLVEPLPPGRLRSAAACRALEAVLRGERTLPAEERADLLQVYARLTGGQGTSDEDAARSEAILDRAMGDRSAAVRLVAIAELQRRGRPPPGVGDLDTALREALGTRDVLMRRTARKEVRAMLLSTEPDATWERRLDLLATRLDKRADRAETAEALVAVARRHDGATSRCAEGVATWLDDRDPRVRGAALAFLGYTGAADYAPRLVDALGSRHPEESQAARQAVVALGSEAAEPLLLAHEFGAPRHRDAIISVLQELEVDASRLESIYAEELAAVRRAALLRAALGADHPARLLCRRLEERVAQGLGALLAFSAVLRSDERIGELERRLRRAQDARRRDILIEALESVLGPEERRELLPLLESQRANGAIEGVAERLGVPTPDREVAWEQLRTDPDPLTRRLRAAASVAGLATARAPVESPAAIDDAPDVGDPIELAVRLQDVAVFDRLTTQQLVGLAEALRERRLEAGETVYQEGDEGSGLYIVLDGSVEISRRGAVLHQVGAGSFFGELAALDGVPRSVSARATEQTTLLRLDRDDLLSLMEDAPALGIALSQHLSTRLRELRERQ